MKGVLLAGGDGKRCEPLTSQYINKHLIPIGGAKMIEYPLQTLKQLGITEVLLITSKQAAGAFVDFFKDGKEFGIDITYRIQSESDGILGGLKLAKNFINNDENFAVILGDNFFDMDLSRKVIKNIKESNFSLFIKHVDKDANQYGCITEWGVQEKPNIESGNVVTGLYIFPSFIFKIIDKFNKSLRNEYEIVDLHNYLLSKYIKNKENVYIMLDDNDKWRDMGNIKTINEMNQIEKPPLEAPDLINIYGKISGDNITVNLK